MYFLTKIITYFAQKAKTQRTQNYSREPNYRPRTSGRILSVFSLPLKSFFRKGVIHGGPYNIGINSTQFPKMKFRTSVAEEQFYYVIFLIHTLLLFTKYLQQTILYTITSPFNKILLTQCLLQFYKQGSISVFLA
ncbi:hypothetical protein Anas_08128 [Armadillidium nasatum]|uniref:Uncharacterized protein n=1 Tax=Armadillidium nasatum TaxID=96803 RepID=A0A5N5SW49_9CRUS|nr:hypothetical protein Anas_08128 [Armadillidium nasatum]